MEVLGWLLILAGVVCVAVAPAFPVVRRRLGLTDDTPEAQAVREFLRSPVGAVRRGVARSPASPRREPGGEAGRSSLAFQLAYPQQVAIEDERGVPVLATDLDFLLRDLNAFAKRGDRWGEANVLNEIGFVQERHGNFGEALEVHSRAMDLFRDLGDPIGLSDSLNDLGVVLARMGENGDALSRHLEALRIREDLGEARVSNSDNNLGVLLARDEREKALAYFAEAAGLATAVGDNRGLGKIINNQTALDLEEARSDENFEHICAQFERTLPLRDRSKDQRGNAKTHNNLGIVHTLWGRPAKAKLYFDKAATLAGSIEDPVALMHVLENWLLLLEVSGGGADEIEWTEGRIAAHRREEQLPALGDLEADCEAYPIALGPESSIRRQVALLSSGSLTPATAAGLRHRLDEEGLAT